MKKRYEVNYTGDFVMLSILSYFPEAMSIYRGSNYHYLIMKHWLIFYEINDYIVEVSHIFSSKQNLNNKFLSD